MNFYNKKTQRTITIVIAAIVVLALVLSVFGSLM